MFSVQIMIRKETTKVYTKLIDGILSYLFDQDDM